jgi:hypothetical protein
MVSSRSDSPITVTMQGSCSSQCWILELSRKETILTLVSAFRYCHMPCLISRHILNRISAFADGGLSTCALVLSGTIVCGYESGAGPVVTLIMDSCMPRMLRISFARANYAFHASVRQHHATFVVRCISRAFSQLTCMRRYPLCFVLVVMHESGVTKLPRRARHCPGGAILMVCW